MFLGRKSTARFLGTLVLTVSAAGATAGTIVVGDSGNNLGFVDTATGVASNVGHVSGVSGALTDIAFDDSGNLFGISNKYLYAIDLSGGAYTATQLGNRFSVGMNSLVIEGGTAYAMAYNDSNLYTIDMTTYAVTQGVDVGFTAGGDLAFMGSQLYLSNSSDVLTAVDTGTGGTEVGSGIGYDQTWGLAAVDGVLYGIAGTELFAIDTGTGAGAASIDVTGISAAYGASTAVVPVPPAVLLFGSGVMGMVLIGRRKKQKQQPEVA